MSKKQGISLYFVSLTSTLLILGLLAMLIFITDKGISEDINLLEVTQSQEHIWQVSMLGKSFEFDYSTLAKGDELRHKYASILTPRAALTVESATDYVVHWGKMLHDALEEYLFTKETYSEAIEV